MERESKLLDQMSPRLSAVQKDRLSQGFERVERDELAPGFHDTYRDLALTIIEQR